MSATESDIRIRSFEPDDLPRVEQITRRSWQRQGGDYFLNLTYGPLGGRGWFDWFWPDVREVFEVHPDRCWVSLADGEVAGFVTCILRPELGTATVGYNAVDPDFRGRRIGRRQIDFLMDHFSRSGLPFSDVVVTINEGHRAAIHLYGSHGYESVVHTEYRCARAENVPVAVPGVPGFEVRPMTGDDRSWACPMVEHTLGPWHRDGRVESMVGRRGGQTWCDRLWRDLADGMAHDTMVGLAFSRGGRPVGCTVSHLDRGRGIGRIDVIACDRPDPTVTESLLCRTARALRERGLPIVQSISWLDPDPSKGRSIDEAMLRGLGFFDLTITNDYRFRRLASDR